MIKRTSILLIVAILFTTSNVFANKDDSIVIEKKLTQHTGENGNYIAMFEVDDWAPNIHGVLLEVENEDFEPSLDPNQYEVKSVRMISGESHIETIEINKVYLADREGVETEDGPYIALDFKIHPDNPSTNLLDYDTDTGLNNWVDIYFTISTEDGLKWDNDISDISHILEGFDFHVYREDNMDINYGIYSPEDTKESRPLVIWLHGGGEGGQDIRLPILANRAIRLAQEDIQKQFDGKGAYVLYPQAPSFWMDEGNREYTKTGASIYVETLQHLIDSIVIDDNYNIDSNRIYIMGPSNGGYMTIKMLLEYPEKYAAGVPIAQGYQGTWLSDEDMKVLLTKPLWFVHASSDPILLEDIHSGAIVEKLKELGHEDLHYALYEGIFDTSDTYFTEENEKYEYHPHFSWVPILNNEISEDIDGQDVLLFTWLSGKSLSNTEEDVQNDVEEKNSNGVYIGLGILVVLGVFALYKKKNRK